MPKPRGEGRHPKSERASGFSFCATTDGRPISRPNGKEAGRRSPKLNYVFYVATAAKNEREREGEREREIYLLGWVTMRKGSC